MQTPAAFISYAHLDDHAYRGRMERLEGMAGSAIGRKFKIFQDRNDIGWGQHWPSRLEEGLNEALFLILILRGRAGSTGAHARFVSPSRIMAATTAVACGCAI